MVEMELRRSAEDRRLYALEGVGTLLFAAFVVRGLAEDAGAAAGGAATTGS